MKLKALLTTLLAALLLASCADPITELKSGLTDDALNRLGATVGTKWENRAATNITISIDGNSESVDISNPVVIKEGNTFKMWYSGKGVDEKWRVIYATSKDGISWTIPHANNPVLVPSSGKQAEDNKGVKVVSVVYDEMEDRYKMWYIGYKTITVTEVDPVTKKDIEVEKIEARLFYARSPYENKGWIKYPNDENSSASDPTAVLEFSDTANNNIPIENATVLRETFYDGFVKTPVYKVWFTYKNGKSYDLLNGRSFNGTLWDLQDFNSLRRAPDTFFVEGIKSPVVIRDYIGNINAYKLWFIGTQKNVHKIGYGISETDGLFFNYYDPAFPPLLSPGEPGEDVNLHDPWVIRDGNKYLMWYVGESVDTKRIYYRESMDY